MTEHDLPVFDLETEMPPPTWCGVLCVVAAVVAFSLAAGAGVLVALNAWGGL